MSPTRRDILKASAGLVAASLVSVPATAAVETPTPPKMKAVSMIMASIRMDDGTTRTLTLTHNHPGVIEAIGRYSEYRVDGDHYEEKMAPEDAEWAAHWIASCAMATMQTLNTDGKISAW